MLRSVWFICLYAALVKSRALGARDVSILHDAHPQVVGEAEDFKASITPRAVFTTPYLLQHTDDSATDPFNTTADFQPVEHLSINVSTGVIHIDASDFLPKAFDALDEAIANWIKGWSNKNVCDPGTGQGMVTEQNGPTVGYLYRTTSTGKDCKTTAEVKTIAAAVAKCMNQANAMKATTVCCKFTHGGTWTGHLQLTSDTERWPANLEDRVCWS